MILAAALLGGCSLNRMIKTYETGIGYTPETNPLENHGGQVAAKVKGDIAAGYFHRRAMLELTPVLKYEGGEKELQTVTLRGSKTKSQGSMVNRDVASNFNLNNVVDFKPEMLASELTIRARLYREGKQDRATVLPERKVADGVINTSQFILNDFDLALAPHGYEKETIVTKRADVFFAYMRHDLNMRLPLNRDAAAQAKINELRDFLKLEWKIKAIEVNAWASPEGEVAFNEKLSENRSKTGERYVNDLFRSLEREMRKTLDRPALTVQAKGEDFAGFMTKLNASNLPDKQAIANVINTQIAPAERERRIKDMTLIYAEIEKILEPLRRAEIVVHTYEPKKTDQEIASLAISDPSKLDEKELLYAATLTDNLQTQLTIYKNAQRLFPRSYKGFNNAAYVYLKMGDDANAASELEKANQLSPGMPCVQNNLGVVAAKAKDDENARKMFEAAKAQGFNANYNLGILMIRKGEYQNAINAFAGRTCTHNIALAQLLSGNDNAAMSTLDCAPESAHTAYLKAVIQARRNNAGQVITNLTKAIQLDPAMKAKAAKDREFIRFFNQADFQALVR